MAVFPELSCAQREILHSLNNSVKNWKVPSKSQQIFKHFLEKYEKDQLKKLENA